MARRKRTTAIGVFEDRRHAKLAVDDLRAAGFSEDQIGLVVKDDKTGKVAEDRNSMVAEGAATGAIAGAGVGALWALGIAAGMLPVIGPVIAGGLLASVLASAAGGAAVAGILGALIGLGVPEDEAAFYEEEFKTGRTLVVVKAGDRYEEALTILQSHNGYDIRTPSKRRTTSPRISAPKTREVSGSKTMPIQNPFSQQSNFGSVDEGIIHKEITSDHRTVEVPVTREDVVVEEVPSVEPGLGGIASSRLARAMPEGRDVPAKSHLPEGAALPKRRGRPPQAAK